LSSNHTGDETGAYTDAEADKSFAFDDQSIRKGFIRKVYLILMVSADIRTEKENINLNCPKIKVFASLLVCFGSL